MSGPTLRRQRAFDEVTARLEAAGVPSPVAEARWLLEYAGALAGERGEPVRRAILRGLVARRVTRVPLQHVIGATWFRHLRLRCRPGVFIPRPETEVVAGRAIAEAGPGALVLEPCTGAGAIALSVASEVRGARVVAGDRDRRAVALARRNLAELRTGRAGPEGLAPGASCEFVHGDLLEGFDPGLRGRVDVLVANPPYLPAREHGSWPPEVADHDPPDALIGGEDGLEVVRALLRAAPGWLRPGGTVILEIDERRGGAVREAARAVGLTDVELGRDLTGADRALVARRPG